MKLSADPKHHDYHPELSKSAQVELNGELMTGLVTYVDEEAGFVDRFLLDSKRNIMRLNDRFLVDRIFGEVHVRP
jgi:hypothetical protein